MKVSEKVRQILSTEPRWNVLATADPDGKVNLAMFGSVELSDDETRKARPRSSRKGSLNSRVASKPSNEEIEDVHTMGSRANCP